MKLLKTLLLSAVIFVPLQGHAQGPIDINTASAEMLASSLNGVGDSRAHAIVKYRTENGNFKSIAELAAVKGVGDKLVERNSDRMMVSQ